LKVCTGMRIHLRHSSGVVWCVVKCGVSENRSECE
jgi:hypothetical protein